MVDRKRRPWVAVTAAPVLAVGLMFAAGAGTASAATTVSQVAGSAFGFKTVGITLFGGPQNAVGPTPTVALQGNASNSPQSASSATGLVQYGPATVFTSDGITVSSSGSTGASGSVKSSATVKDINKATTQTSTGSEALTVTDLASSCTADAGGTSGSTTVTGGTLVTDNGTTPPTTVTVPANPAPNTRINGVLRVNGSTDSWHYIFNEQTKTGGTLTVNAVDEYFDGPILKGNLIIGQSVCGVTTAAAAGGTSATTSGTSSSTSTGAVSAASVVPPATGAGGGHGLALPIAVLAVLGGGLMSVAAVALRRGRRRDL